MLAALLAAAKASMAAGIGTQPSIVVNSQGFARIVTVTDYSLQAKYYWQGLGYRLDGKPPAITWWGKYIPNATPSLLVSAAVKPQGNDMYVVAKASDGSIIYYYSADGTQWYPQTVAGAGTTDDRPAIAVGPEGGAHVVARKTDGSLMYYYSPGGGVWYPKLLSAPAGYFSPQIAIGPTGYAHVVAKKASGGLDYFYSQGGGIWSKYYVPAGDVYRFAIGVDGVYLARLYPFAADAVIHSVLTD
jgi:hypothetical protein